MPAQERKRTIRCPQGLPDGLNAPNLYGIVQGVNVRPLGSGSNQGQVGRYKMRSEARDKVAASLDFQLRPAAMATGDAITKVTAACETFIQGSYFERKTKSD